MHQHELSQWVLCEMYLFLHTHKKSVNAQGGCLLSTVPFTDAVLL